MAKGRCLYFVTFTIDPNKGPIYPNKGPIIIFGFLSVELTPLPRKGQRREGEKLRERERFG